MFDKLGHFKLRQNGYGNRDATIIAGREATKYQANRIAFYEQAKNAFGFNDARTQLNEFGQTMQNRIEEERPSAANYRNTLATPAQQFANDFTTMTNAIQHGYGIENMNTQANLQDWLANNNFGRDLTKTQIAQAFQKEMAQNNFEYQSALKAQIYKQEIAKIDYQMSLASKQEQEEYDKLVQRGMDAGLTEAEAKIQAYKAKYGKNTSKVKLSGEDNAVAGILTSAHNQALNGDFDGALSRLYELKALADDPESDYSKNLSQEARAALDAKIAELEDLKAKAIEKVKETEKTDKNNTKSTRVSTSNNKGGYDPSNSKIITNGLGQLTIVPKNTSGNSGTTNPSLKKAIEDAKNLTGYGNVVKLK